MLNIFYSIDERFLLDYAAHKRHGIFDGGKHVYRNVGQLKNCLSLAASQQLDVSGKQRLLIKPSALRKLSLL